MAEYSVKKEQLINWKILKQSEGQLLATNAYALLTSDYFSFSKTQCAVFKGTDRAVFLDKREFTGPIYTQIKEAVDFVLRNIRLEYWLFQDPGSEAVQDILRSRLLHSQPDHFQAVPDYPYGY